MKVIGIDLAGKPKNPTGVYILNKEKRGLVLYTDEEILEVVRRENPDLIAIDAPFQMPKSGWWRDSDLALKKAGFRPLSPKFPGMQPLVRRAERLLKLLKPYRVIEVFPRATEKILGLQKAERANQHIYDAMLCALTGKAYLEGKYRALGKQRIIIPL
ncbi:MAG: hypothetical protein DRP12_02595 [Candidatus Aenigmatarchaeota archaeon]|nr:MAG: hypothetical protein DRP12_02595 [Candidatus Aenigmarchaeota archaeon]